VKGSGRIIISVPPAHGKSELCSKWLPLWYLNNNPKRRLIVCSYNQHNADKWGRILRNLISENQDVLDVKISHDSKAKRFWHTTQNGSILCAGTGGTLTGNHADLIIIDDPFKNWEDAMSQTKRENVIEWYNSSICTRLLPNASIILIMTRWHEGDLAGYLLKESGEKWTNLRLPAIAEKDGDLLKRKEGELLCPELFEQKYFGEQKKRMGSMQFAALYQQSPQAATGNIFLRNYWQKYTFDAKPLKFDRIIQSWDTAFETKKSNSYTACTTWGQKEKRFYLLKMWRAKADYPTVKKKMFDLYKSEKASIVLLEDKATGKPLRQELRLAGLPIIAVEPVADKLTRAHSVAPIFEDARVFAPIGESWADELIAGCASYPAGDWADVVDTISQALAWMAQTNAINEKMLDALLQIGVSGGISSYIRNRTHDLPYRGIFKFGRNYYE
jgi:predicted phage terminase large subunit-like protein